MFCSITVSRRRGGLINESDWKGTEDPSANRLCRNRIPSDVSVPRCWQNYDASNSRSVASNATGAEIYHRIGCRHLLPGARSSNHSVKLFCFLSSAHFTSCSQNVQRFTCKTADEGGVKTENIVHDFEHTREFLVHLMQLYCATCILLHRS